MQGCNVGPSLWQTPSRQAPLWNRLLTLQRLLAEVTQACRHRQQTPQMSKRCYVSAMPCNSSLSMRRLRRFCSAGSAPSLTRSSYCKLCSSCAAQVVVTGCCNVPLTHVWGRGSHRSVHSLSGKPMRMRSASVPPASPVILCTVTVCQQHRIMAVPAMQAGCQPAPMPAGGTMTSMAAVQA